MTHVTFRPGWVVQITVLVNICPVILRIFIMIVVIGMIIDKHVSSARG